MIKIDVNNRLGYNRIVEFESWTVANLSSCSDTTINGVTWFQKHNETDEVFILLEGSACLILLEGDKFDVNKLQFVHMEKDKAYTIKKNVYHQHVLGENTNLCIVENSNTCDDNSPQINLSQEQINEFIEFAKEKINV